MFILMLLVFIIATLMLLVWLFLLFRYRKQYEGLLDNVDGKIFTMKDVYFLGLGCIEIYERVKEKKITVEPKAIERMKELGEIFGRDSAELYYYITTASRISLVLTFVPIGAMLFCIMKSWIGLLIGGLLSFAMIRGVQSTINASIQRKKDEIISEFPKMVSKITLLINANMQVRRAWDEVANSNFQELLYEEMRNTSKDIQEGMAIDVAMQSFAQRCGIKEIRRFSSLYVQAVNRGAGETIESMKAMADDAWMQKKEISKQKGEIASQKLIIPNMIMFLGILAVVVAPMLISMMGNL